MSEATHDEAGAAAAATAAGEVPAEARRRWEDLAEGNRADQFACYVRDAPVSSEADYGERT